jgi:hypothetical protein
MMSTSGRVASLIAEKLHHLPAVSIVLCVTPPADRRRWQIITSMSKGVIDRNGSEQATKGKQRKAKDASVEENG